MKIVLLILTLLISIPSFCFERVTLSYCTSRNDTEGVGRTGCYSMDKNNSMEKEFDKIIVKERASDLSLKNSAEDWIKRGEDGYKIDLIPLTPHLEKDQKHIISLLQELKSIKFNEDHISREILKLIPDHNFYLAAYVYHDFTMVPFADLGMRVRLTLHSTIGSERVRDGISIAYQEDEIPIESFDSLMVGDIVSNMTISDLFIDDLNKRF